MCIPEGHDCCCQRNTGDGIEIREMGKDEMDRSKDHDEVGEFNLLALTANQIVEFLEGCSSGNHVDYVDANFDDQLLRNHDVKTKFFAECMLTELVVSVESFPWNHFVHFDHLP